MKPLSDAALRHLREVADWPDLGGTRYEVVERVARGGMGTVYRVRDRSLDRDLALKVMSLPEAEPETIARMMREARILARLEHPGIVPVHDVGTLPDGRTFYTMKLVRGNRLDGYLRERRPRDELLRIFIRICEAVAFAHAQGVIHRDLKPSNVMVGAFGEVLVMDWGVAKLVRGSGGRAADGELPGGGRQTGEPAGLAEGERGATSLDTEPGTILGTPGFMAPEQAAGLAEAVDERADIFALGVILRHMLTGGDKGAGAVDEGRSRSSMPKPLAAIVRKATAPNAEGRYADVETLARDLNRFQAGEPVSAHRESWLDRGGRIFNKYRTAIFLVLAYLLMRVLLLIVAER